MTARLAPLLVLLVAACGEASDHPAAVHADSAGIAIVTSTAPRHPAGSWRVDTVPERTIGDPAQPDAAFLLGVTGVHLLSDGRLAVVTAQDGRITWHDRDGRTVAALDSATFARPRLVAAHADTLWVYDATNRQLAVVGPDAAIARRLRVADGVVPAMRLADGTIVATAPRRYGLGEGIGPRRDPVPLHRLAADGTPDPEPFARVTGPETVLASTSEFVSTFPRSFGAQVTLGASGSVVQATAGDRDEVVRIGADGVLQALWRLDRPRREIPLDDLRRHGLRRGDQVAQLPPMVASRVTEAILAAGVPSILATFDQQLVDDAGRTWLRDDIGPERRDSLPQQWQVLDAEGRWLATVTTPRRLTVWQVAGDRVVGLWRDRYDAEQVRTYRLRR